MKHIKLLGLHNKTFNELCPGYPLTDHKYEHVPCINDTDTDSNFAIAQIQQKQWQQKE
ncbi:MAG: hypothetical protein HF976_00720 [ANME-2 cluster archaeon]|nr:hypothetical protein [ANME-2 cluster archaeon]MBC2699935.1 hypothetical protein [ANME-2 cluster archaeon]MBC2707048.1 hypothetical protein [ANME-2 cluster archaeon]MBC2746938.1 hypothetical protein [ANME-2 cluster archaeon]MBC2762360.1 hypothetical protein [ANME-2 cluster archaeon]